MLKPLPWSLAALCLAALASVSACGAPPPLAPPPAAVIQVAASPAAAEADTPDDSEPEVLDGDPGPLPVTRADPQWGKRHAPVTLVVFADYQCPFCSRLEGTIAELKRRYGAAQLRVVHKHNPLAFHDKAGPAAAFAAAYHERFGDKGFWRLHAALYADQRQLDGVISDAAASMGADLAQLRASSAWLRAEQKVEADMALGKLRGVTGTPASFINGVFLSGAQPVDKFTAIIDEQLAAARDLASRGTAPSRIYAELSAKNFKAPAPAPSRQPDDETTVWKVELGKAPVRGKAAALVTIVEFSEFQCPFCARVVPTLNQLQKEYGDKVRLVWKHNPLPFHPRAAPAAELTFEARAQRGEAGFWAAHDLLFKRECVGQPQLNSMSECNDAGGNWVESQQNMTDGDLLLHARALGLDQNKVMAAITHGKHKAEIEADQDQADDLKAGGTPHFFINGRRLVGAQPVEKFRAMIDEEVQKAEALVRAGTPAARVYEKLMATAKTPDPPEKKVIAAPTRQNPSRGPANAKVVVQMFSDFQCPFCKRVNPTIEELENAFPKDVRVVWRNVPLPFHKDAVPAAEAAMEAFAQKGDRGFWAMYELIFAAQGQPDALGRQALEGYAAQLGLDMQRFSNALDTHVHVPAIEADKKIANDAGIHGTPAFVVGEYYISGAQSLPKFRKAVEMALGKRK